MIRLRNFAHPKFSKSESDTPRALIRDPKEPQHHGLIHASEPVVFRSAVVLNFLLRFLDTKRLPKLSDDEKTENGDDAPAPGTHAAHMALRCSAAPLGPVLRSFGLSG